MSMERLTVQSRYTCINSWYRAPRLVRFSDRLVRQMTRSGREFVQVAKVDDRSGTNSR
jgi:hypothetical protein